MVAKNWFKLLFLSFLLVLVVSVLCSLPGFAGRPTCSTQIDTDVQPTRL